MTRRSLLGSASLLLLLHSGLHPGLSGGATAQVKIGVLAHRGPETTLKAWGPTADYLAESIPERRFSIVPLNFREIGPAVERGEVDFVLANSSISVELEGRYGVSPIATLKNRGSGGGQTRFGGVIFCRADRTDIGGLPDLRGKSFLAVDETSLGGWRVAWRELKSSGLDPYRDFRSLRFADTHDAVVGAIRDGKADAGTVRTDILERMAEEGKIDLQAFRILNERHEADFPFRLSTRLYPEWPLSKLRHADSDLAEEVASALYKMPHEHAAARAGNNAGWTIPHNYQPVHDLLKELRLGPYADLGEITPSAVIRLYWHWIVLGFTAMLVLIIMAWNVVRLNKRLITSKQLVEDARNGLEQEVRERTASLEETNRLLCAEVAVRKKAEEEIRRAKEEWERTFDAIADPIMLLDTNFQILKANRSMADALGLSPAHVVGLTCYEAVHGTAQPTDACPHARLLADGQARTQEIYESRLGGGHYLVTVSPLRAPDGTLVGSVHAARDISSLKEAEQVIRQYLQNLERLLSISRETTLATDLKSLYRVFVRASAELLNLDFSTLLLFSEDKKSLVVQDTLGFPESMIGNFTLVEGQGLSTLVVKSRRAEVVQDFAGEARFEVPPIVREKEIRSALAVPMMMKEEVTGALIGHTLARRVFSQDELDLYQLIANQAAVAIRNAMNADLLRKNEKHIRDVTASLSEGVYVLNARGEITFMNPEAESLLGWSEKELIHRNIHDLVHSRRADGSPLPFEDCEMRKIIETGNRFHSTDEVFIRKDGTVFPVSVFSTPLLEDGKVVASVTAFRDISGQKQRERERERLVADLQRALAEIKTLHGILPMCAYCKKIRDEAGAWTQLESYLSKHTDSQFSHGMCPECAKKEFPQYYP